MGQQYRPPPRPARRTGRILLVLWAILTAAQLGYVLAFGHNQPWADEWEFVPTLTGHEETAAFYLQPHNEHRLPLPRAIYLGLWDLTRDFRSGMILQVALLSAMAHRGLRLAAKLRGEARWADAFFPLSLLHVGHCENLLMGYQLCFVLASALAFGVLELAVRWTPENGPQTALLAALAALALTLCGGFGIVLAIPISIWVLVLIARNGMRGVGSTAVAVGCLIAAAAYLGFVFTTYQRPPDHPPFQWTNWFASLQVAGEFLAISLGIGVGAVWFAVLPLLGVALGIAIREALHSTPRIGSLGIASVAVGVVLLSLAIGAGRGGFGSQMGLWPRYSVLAWPLLAAIYFASLQNQWVPTALMVAAVFAFLPNTFFGLDYGRRHDDWLDSITSQLKNGFSTKDIVEHSLKGNGQEARALRGIPMLHEAKIGPFADWKGSP